MLVRDSLLILQSSLLIEITASLGVIQLCTFILLLLSGERDFAVSLNKPIIGARLPSDLPRPPGSSHYSHFDFLAVVAFKVLTDGGPATVSGASASQHLAPVRGMYFYSFLY